MDYITKYIDDISFVLKKDYDFSWLNTLGKVIKVFDQQDSGNICFGIQAMEKILFVKCAGPLTINYEGKPIDAINRMKEAVKIYEAITHNNLIKLLNHYPINEGYVSVYEWVDGECLHAHWNFDKYPKYTHPMSPNYKFRQLKIDQKLNCLDAIFDLHCLVAKEGYVAIDFYDGSIMYDFNRDQTTICDIDFYHKGSMMNMVGRMWGSSRFMSPEEFEKGAIIDEVTNVYTMGATAFELLGCNRNRNFENWTGSKEQYDVAKKAVNDKRSERYPSIDAFFKAWKGVS